MRYKYKPNLDESVDRFQKLWSREAMDRVLVKIDIQDPDSPTVMNAMARVPDYGEMVDEWEKGFLLNRDVADDNLPVVYGELGGYIIGGFLGAEVSWGAGGAYPEKLIRDMKRYREFLKFNEENEYFRMQINYIKYLAERSKGKFGFTEMITIDGLNFLDCVRGGDAYTDLFDYPQEITQIMGFGSDLNIKLVRMQRSLIETYRGGRFNFYQIWTPGETIFISVDAYGQCSPGVFEKFGRKYVQRMVDEFHGGWLHVHSDAMRLLPNYITMRGLVAIGLEDWIKPPRAIDHINEIIEITGDVPLMINIEKNELLAMMEAKTLPGNVLYWVGGVRNEDEANRIALGAYGYRSRYKRRLY
jgi:hypothetical protein